MTLAILLLGLVVATCIIAYLADTLGKNLGKKRVSLFGMRPRTTATMLSMASSVGIMLFTVGILLLTSHSLANALLRYDEQVRLANQARKRANEAVKHAEDLTQRLQTQNTSTQKTINASKASLARLRNALNDTHNQLASTRLRLSQAQQARASAERIKNVAMQSAARARGSAQTALARYRQAQQAFNRLGVQLQAAKVQVQRARRQLLAEQKRVSQVNGQLKNLQNSLLASRGQLDDAKKQLNQAVSRRDEAKAQLETAKAGLAQAQASFATAETQLNNTLKQYESAQTKLAELEKRTDLMVQKGQFLATVAKEISTGDISVRQGTVFAEKSIEPMLAESEVRTKLQELVEAGQAALAKEKNTFVLAPLNVTNGDRTVTLKGGEIINSLADYISASDVPVSVRFMAARDHATSETEIFISFLAVPVRTVYTEGEVLAEAYINASSDARVFNQLLALLNQGEAAGRNKGVQPLLSTENPYFFAAGTNERIFETMRSIQAINEPVHVRLVAAENLNTTDPVRVRFEVSAIDMHTAPIIAIDPGKDKCGVAVATLENAKVVVLARRIVPAGELEQLLPPLLQEFKAAQIILGDATTSSAWRTRLEGIVPGVTLVLVKEANSTFEGRSHYWKAHPPRGWRRLIPLSLQAPPVPIDDFAAVVLAERFFAAKANP